MCTEKHTAAELAIVERVFSKLPIIRVYIPDDAGFGNQVNAYFTIQRYLELGYKNNFEVIYSEASADKVSTLFAMSSVDLKANHALQSWHPKIRFVKEEALVRFPELFQHVQLTLAGARYTKGVATLKTDLFVAPDNGFGMFITTGTGKVLVDDLMTRKFGRQIFTPIATLKSIRELFRNTDYGRIVQTIAPGVPAIVESVAQGKMNVMVTYGMHWSFRLPNHRILANIAATVCQIKTEQARLQKPTLILVLNELWWWDWRKIRSTLNNVLASGEASDLANLTDHLRPCSSADTTIPILSTGVELVEYMATATVNSVALVRMPNIHPDVYSYLVQMSPFPNLIEGRSSYTLLTNLNRPGIRASDVITFGDKFAPLINIFRQFLDHQSELWRNHLQSHKIQCTQKEDLVFQTVLEADNHLHLELIPSKDFSESIKQLPIQELNSQLNYLHFKDYLFCAMAPSALISSGNTLYKRRTTSYSTAALVKYSLLLGDGYINSRLPSNILLIMIDMISELGFETEIACLAAIPILQNVIGWTLYYPASIPEVKQRSLEFASSCAGAVVGKVCGNIITNVACNSASWFYRRLYGTCPALPVTRSNANDHLDLKNK